MSRNRHAVQRSRPGAGWFARIWASLGLIRASDGPQTLRGDDDGFLFRVVVEHLGAVLFSVAAVFGPAERELIVRDLHGVDPCVAGFELVDGALGAIHISRENAG